MIWAEILQIAELEYQRMHENTTNENELLISWEIIITTLVLQIQRQTNTDTTPRSIDYNTAKYKIQK